MECPYAQRRVEAGFPNKWVCIICWHPRVHSHCREINMMGIYRFDSLKSPNRQLKPSRNIISWTIQTSSAIMILALKMWGTSWTGEEKMVYFQQSLKSPSQHLQSNFNKIDFIDNAVLYLFLLNCCFLNRLSGNFGSFTSLSLP